MLRSRCFAHSINRLRPHSRRFTVLAVESSADDTCAAVVTSTRQILSNVVIKQHDMNSLHGGIHPYEAILQHQKNMPQAIARALQEAELQPSDLDGIAYTRGPGMAGCLGMGYVAAHTLAATAKKPIVGVHHMQAHALTPMLTNYPNIPEYPFLTLLVSGGHTLILLARSVSSFKILATTVDESIGRTYDKVGRWLELPWGKLGLGAAMEAFCASPLESEWPEGLRPFPDPMKGELGFSYAALHSHAERFITNNGGVANLSPENRVAIARDFQRAAIAQLEEKLGLAFKWCNDNEVPVRHLVVSGGVASNQYLRDRLDVLLSSISIDRPVASVFPPPSLCTDNAVMIAWASMHRFLARDYDSAEAQPRKKWSIEDIEDGK